MVTLAAAILAGSPLVVSRATAADVPAKSVRLTIDYGDGVQKVFRNLAWKDGLTVLDALAAAGKHARGFKVEHRGTGATALVTAIDGLKNEGTGRNWLYEVNDKLGDKSCGAFVLKAGDAVLWRFGEYE